MATRRFTGKTVDEATDLALETLELNQEEVEIVVVNPGRSGILGFGGEPAEIHVTPLMTEKAETDGTSPSSSPDASGQARGDRSRRGGRGRRGRGGRTRRGASSDGAQESKSSDQEDRDDRPDGASRDDQDGAVASDDQDIRESEPASVASPIPDEAEKSDQPEASKDNSATSAEEVPERTKPSSEEIENTATEILDRVLSAMDVSVNTFVVDDQEDSDIAFDIEGDDAGLLIGRRGETLQAMQFLVNLLLNKRLESSVFVTIDVEGYRERRREALRDSAEAAAERVADSGDSQTMPPMNAADRRIVHMALADNPNVTTQSRGEGQQRRVVVSPQE